MNLRYFIERPVFSAVISITIVVIGLISLLGLPVEQFPNIAPPTVVVSTNYFGASAETLQKSVIAPLEEAINGVENMNYITSSATNSGTVSINVYFKQGTDPDMAAVNVQNRVSKATGQLPAEVTQVGVTTAKRQTSMLQIFSLYSPDGTYDENFISNYIAINLKPEILRITGVGDLMVMGGDYSMRIWMKPDVMAQYGLSPSDITSALAEQNIESATGSLGENSTESFQYTMKYSGRLVLPEEFEEIVIRSNADGSVLRLKDVADVELGKESYAYVGQTNGKPGISCMIYQTPGSNATEVNNNITAFLKQAEENLPEGLEIVQLMSSNDFLYASIHEVIKTLIEAVILVILIVFIFLQDFRATIIPLVGIVVSLIGTFAFMAIAGFSLNLITLFALVLVIGTVVDDAIVVVEAVQAKFDVGYKSSYMASIDAMKGIGSAVFSSSLVFMAVFIPVSFMSGTAGAFYKQFGLSMAVAVGISAINALTLSPALCAILLKPHSEKFAKSKSFTARFKRAYDAAFGAMLGKYKGALSVFINHRWLPWSILALSVVVLGYLMANTKTSLVPEEDQGTVFVNVSTAPGSSLYETTKAMDKIEAAIKDIPEIDNYNKTSGFGLISGQGSCFGMFIIKLKPWDERTGKGQDVQSVIKNIYARTSGIKEASVFAMAPGMIPGYGLGNSVDTYIQDKGGSGDVTELYNITMNFISEIQKRPEIARAYSSFNIKYPQWQVDVDAAKCKRAGISPKTVLNTISGYYGGQYASNFNRFSRVYRVMIQASPEYREDKQSLDNIYVPVNGKMAPVSQFATLTKVYGAESLTRFNMYNAIQVSITPNEGYSTGEAINAVMEVADSHLPKGFGFEFGGITREESQQSNTTLVFIFAICVLLIYLILSALYESFILPLAVILSVPCGLMGSFLFAKLFGLENNIYLQTGLIMLIGLLSKTAILITEYAAERRAAGMTLKEAAINAAQARLRPVLMTALTMIFGMLPLMASTGVGANGNRSLGTGTVGGMLIGTLALLLLVPQFFIFFQKLQEKITPHQSEKTGNWQIQEEQKSLGEWKE